MEPAERERNIYHHVCFASIASGIALILSLVVMLKYNYRTNLEIDYLGAIAGVLSLFVAVFVGVQIYQSFNLKRDIDEQNKKLLDNAIDKFTDKNSALQNELAELKEMVDEKCKDCKSYVDKQIQKERDKEMLNDMYQMALENMRNKNYPLAFIGFCNVAIIANKNKEDNFLIRSIEWAISLIEQEEKEIINGIKKYKFQQITEDMEKINANGVEYILDFIRNHTTK